MDYKVRLQMNDRYEVYSATGFDEVKWIEELEVHYRGSLADCEAWIRLTTDNRM